MTMTMNDVATPILSVLAGVFLSVFFFGGLWWTVRRALSMRQPALLVMASMLGRSGLVLLGFYVVADGRWQNLLYCLAGFIAARLIVTRLLPADIAVDANPAGRISRHAP
jgi:F1F0 ATPase subunit 2